MNGAALLPEREQAHRQGLSRHKIQCAHWNLFHAPLTVSGHNNAYC